MSSENTQTYAPQPPQVQFHRLKKERDMLIEERWDCEKVKKEHRVECKQIVDKVKGHYDRMKQMREDITKRIGVLNKKVRSEGSEIEGCSFHLAQAWNRRKNAAGLRQRIQGLLRDRSNSRWWGTIKAVVFLPEKLRNNVRALRTPPVTRAHPACNKCAQFLWLLLFSSSMAEFLINGFCLLRYIKSTWLTGPFVDLWSKWEITTLRTTNVAEAFHR
ncbi:unnamed protein product [Nippostrongylus brasiliensis]|uniref:Uncharacterized protein n=1 Tax=Nippostrongylus brasiliensis TaxID=27835 RepID=A0A0N4Y1E2_NIPBR|nr:unnamed protein product [Nippostrongylus brasiliensis]